MQNNGKERQKSLLHVQICFLLIRKKVCCTCNFFLIIRSIDHIAPTHPFRYLLPSLSSKVDTYDNKQAFIY